jgi:hypothetical protein
MMLLRTRRGRGRRRYIVRGRRSPSSAATLEGYLGLVYIEKNLNLMNSIIFVLFDKYCLIVD